MLRLSLLAAALLQCAALQMPVPAHISRRDVASKPFGVLLAAACLGADPWSAVADESYIDQKRKEVAAFKQTGKMPVSKPAAKKAAPRPAAKAAPKPAAPKPPPLAKRRSKIGGKPAPRKPAAKPAAGPKAAPRKAAPRRDTNVERENAAKLKAKRELMLKGRK